MATRRTKAEPVKETPAQGRPKGYASETKVSPLQSVGTFPAGTGNAPSAAELAERNRANAERARNEEQ